MAVVSHALPRIGEINPDQLKDHPRARALSRVEIEYCRFAWSAITAPDPGMLDDEWIGGCRLSSGGGELWFYENGRVEAIR